MQIEQFLREVTFLLGLSGNEQEAARYVAKAFEPLCDEVHMTPLNSVVGYKKGTGNGPKVMFAAHIDEIGLNVTKIEEDGSLRMGSIGGVDPRILPGMRVRVHGRETLLGVVGAKPPHILTEEERKKNYKRDDLAVDLGMPAKKVKELVQVGDLIQLEHRFVELKNGRFTTKTADDRACVAILYEAMKLLQGRTHEADLFFVATSQEEIGANGAMTAAFAVDPDFGVALDVCHASTPDAPKEATSDLVGLDSAIGPFIQPVLRKKLMDVAAKENVVVQSSVSPSRTGTDADVMGITRAGIPMVLLSLPLKYMHTTVELFDMRTLEEGGRLIAAFSCAVKNTWEDELWT